MNFKEWLRLQEQTNIPASANMGTAGDSAPGASVVTGTERTVGDQFKSVIGMGQAMTGKEEKLQSAQEGGMPKRELTTLAAQMAGIRDLQTAHKNALNPAVSVFSKQQPTQDDQYFQDINVQASAWQQFEKQVHGIKEVLDKYHLFQQIRSRTPAVTAYLRAAAKQPNIYNIAHYTQNTLQSQRSWGDFFKGKQKQHYAQIQQPNPNQTVSRQI